MNPMEKHIESVKAALPATALELMAETGLSRSYLGKTLCIMRILGLIHISEYTKTKEANAPVYAAGAGVDAEYPKKTVRVKEPKQPKVKEPRLPFKLPKRCELKTRVVIPDSPYRTVWRSVQVEDRA